MKGEGASISDAYFGTSGALVADMDFYGKLDVSSEFKTDERDLKLVTLSGLSEKRALYAVFKFQGFTPVYITNTMFEADKKALKPSFYLAVSNS